MQEGCTLISSAPVFSLINFTCANKYQRMVWFLMDFDRKGALYWVGLKEYTPKVSLKAVPQGYA